jgi:phosphatidate phosphatase APP1
LEPLQRLGGFFKVEECCRGEADFATDCIVSDIDDTLFNTSGCLPIPLAFVNTFIKYPKPIKGMPELFHLVKSELSRARFWYISASPYNVFPYFRSKLSLSGYPTGNTIIPSWKEALLIYSVKSAYIYKIECIERLQWFYSSYKVICFGDSLMKDPEVYGEIFRRHHNWMFIILIRIIGSKNHYRNREARFRKAFTAVPVESYYVYREPEEASIFLKKCIARMIRH